MILDLYRILFHAVVIFGPEHDFLFKSASSYCVQDLTDAVIPLPSDLLLFLDSECGKIRATGFEFVSTTTAIYSSNSPKNKGI